MWDQSVPMIGLAMRTDALDHLPEFELPAEYGWRYFQPGDERLWADIETSAGEFRTQEDGIRGFRRYYPTDDGLDERMIFLTDHGVPFATATAWFGEDGEEVPDAKIVQQKLFVPTDVRLSQNDILRRDDGNDA